MKCRWIYVLWVLCFSPAAASAAWTPPVGIPNPPFGINEVPGTPTHYVDSSDPNATDSGNPNGTPTQPRRTVPTSLAAGSVVQVRGGSYTIGNVTWTGNGTAASPVIIYGLNRPTFDGGSSGGQLNIAGSYVIVDGFLFTRMRFRMPNTHHIAWRNNEMRDWPGTSATSILSLQGSDLVVYNNHIHHNGNSQQTAELDVIGVSAAQYANRVWIVDNHIHHNGDAIRTGDNPPAPEPRAQFVYIGRNELHDDQENAIDVKQGRDIIVSQNLIYNYKVTNSSGGEGIVTHYDAERVWIMFNRIHHTVKGVVSTGAIGYYVIGNVFHDIANPPGSDYDPTSLYGPAAILTYSTTDSYHVGNTIWNVAAGISYATGSSKTEIVNNIIGNVLQASHSVAVGNGTAANAAVFRNNLFSGTIRIKWGTSGATSSLTDCVSCVAGNPQFLSPLTGDFRLAPGSPAIDRGVTHSVYATYRTRYGVDISRDLDGGSRPVGGAWDIGAYESGTLMTGPAPPNNLRIVPPGQ